MRPLVVSVVLLMLASGPAPSTAGQGQPSGFSGAQEPRTVGPPEMGWTPEISEVPLVDLSGSWRFAPRLSDPMVQQWRDVPVLYGIQQLSDRILLDFRPEGGRSNVQAYRWNGEVEDFERGQTEVRERARWTDGGRMLVIEGRWWDPDIPDELNAYTFRYRLDGPDRLVFVQENESGETVWVFERE